MNTKNYGKFVNQYKFMNLEKLLKMIDQNKD